MQPLDFPKAFIALTGSPPFPWQSALHAGFIYGRVSALASVSIPAGLGKTAVIAVWPCALAQTYAPEIEAAEKISIKNPEGHPASLRTR